MYRYVRVNMSTGNVRILDLPRERWSLGGRGLISQILYTEMDPGADPLCAKNVMVLAPGMFAGYPLSCFDEIFLGAKSPSTGRLENVRFMSRASRLMAAMNIRLAIFEGQPADTRQHVLVLDRGRVSLATLDDLMPSVNPEEIGSYALHKGLQEHFGRNACIITWGHAALFRSPDASLLVSGASEGILKNIPGRGLCSVMASKGVRAIVLRGGSPFFPPKASGNKAESICHDTECLLCCARLHAELQNTPYAKASLCRDCIEQTPPSSSLEKICTDLGLCPTACDPELLPFTASDEATLRRHLLEISRKSFSLPPHQHLPEIHQNDRAIAAFDSMGLCPHALRPEEHDKALNLMADLAEAVYGGAWNRDTLLRMGTDTLNKEQAFNNWAEAEASGYR
ncbi:aldehyde ferredoxin oxidoreductase N-terminal domain-containing protein [uncultured Mailhella sp.]|uniref:aldehyde ferredoxin oxidoreductase N-terminal domain-containing protein n=1 Tax=uncultured Mailhella sp. TaxID=1981031 RepID=UPI00261B7539|nr:aldehyde ferredoxin oxidoreductase N-terminal domain-containing protein [uncultured Mailhella sp.]